MEIKTDGMYGGQKVEVVRLPDGERDLWRAQRPACSANVAQVALTAKPRHK